MIPGGIGIGAIFALWFLALSAAVIVGVVLMLLNPGANLWSTFRANRRYGLGWWASLEAAGPWTVFLGILVATATIGIRLAT